MISAASEPQAYISPKHYDKFESVPTWSYYAVHAYGACSLVLDRSKAFRALEDMIMTYEADYIVQWDALTENFKDKMLNGIVAFQITVTEIQASQKMSQNKNVDEQERIIHALKDSSDSPAQAVAEYMSSNLKNRS